MTPFYAGSFDPFTIGHLSIAKRAMAMFDELVIGIGCNLEKQNDEAVERRVEKIKSLFANEKGVSVVAYEGLTAEAAKELGAQVLVRGVRNAIDFEKEKELADINLEVFYIPTVMIPAAPGLSYVSSSLVRELKHFGCEAWQDFEA